MRCCGLKALKGTMASMVHEIPRTGCYIAKYKPPLILTSRYLRVAQAIFGISYFLVSMRVVIVPDIGKDMGPVGPPSALIEPESCCEYRAPTVQPLDSSISTCPLRSPETS